MVPVLVADKKRYDGDIGKIMTKKTPTRTLLSGYNDQGQVGKFPLKNAQKKIIRHMKKGRIFVNVSFYDYRRYYRTLCTGVKCIKYPQVVRTFGRSQDNLANHGFSQHHRKLIV